MLGPVDINDWEFGEDDLLRAEIRILPVVVRFNAEPQGMSRLLGKALCARLLDFHRGKAFEIAALRRLHADLTAVEYR